MPRPPKYPFARFAPGGADAGELFVTEITYADGGLAAVERMQSAAYTYAKRNGLVCKTARTIVDTGEDIARSKVRSAIQFADKIVDSRGDFYWDACFNTTSRAADDAAKTWATRQHSELLLKVCRNCLAEYDPERLAVNECPECGRVCTACGQSTLDVGPPATTYAHPTSAPGADIPPPPAPEDVSPDSESDVPQPEPEPDLASAPDLFTATPAPFADDEATA